MNKIYKVIWSPVRRKFVVASEVKNSHHKCSKSESLKSSGPSSLLSSLPIALSAIALTCAFNVKAGVPEWTAAEYIEDPWPNQTISWQGATFGQIDETVEGGSYDPEVSSLLVVRSGTKITTGVFGVDTDKTSGVQQDKGEIGLTGRYRYDSWINEGSIEDSKEYTNASGETKQQSGSVWWFNRFYNGQDASFAAKDLRILDTLINEGENFSTESLLVKSGSQIENSGKITASQANFGVNNPEIFSERTVKNSGTMEIGSLVNWLKITDSGDDALWKVDRWDNNADVKINEAQIDTLYNQAKFDSAKDLVVNSLSNV